MSKSTRQATLASRRRIRTFTIHHRASPGTGKVDHEPHALLCPGCHAKTHRTKAVLSAMPTLLLELWREQHPKGYEQVQLDFRSKKPAAKLVPLFGEEETLSDQNRSVSAFLKTCVFWN